MASAKEIRNQIKAIENTAKITKAMEMVAASKMRKAQENVLAARPYSEGISQIVSNLMQAHPEYKHPFVTERENVKRIGLVVITTDKGLCGGLNTNALKAGIQFMKAQSQDVDIFSIGRRGAMFMRRIGADVLGSANEISDAPEISEIIPVIQLAMKKYMDGDLDEIHILYSNFVNTMTQRPAVTRLLPCPMPENKAHEGYWDYLYEPDSKEVLDGLLQRYVESLVFHGVLENKACEQSARMVAMKSATDNALEITKDLSITYNKARQATITQELAEICAGAAAAR